MVEPGMALQPTCAPSKPRRNERRGFRPKDAARNNTPGRVPINAAACPANGEVAPGMRQHRRANPKVGTRR